MFSITKYQTLVIIIFQISFAQYSKYISQDFFTYYKVDQFKKFDSKITLYADSQNSLIPSDPHKFGILIESEKYYLKKIELTDLKIIFNGKLISGPFNISRRQNSELPTQLVKCIFQVYPDIGEQNTLYLQYGKNNAIKLSYTIKLRDSIIVKRLIERRKKVINFLENSTNIDQIVSVFGEYKSKIYSDRKVLITYYFDYSHYNFSIFEINKNIIDFSFGNNLSKISTLELKKISKTISEQQNNILND